MKSKVIACNLTVEIDKSFVAEGNVVWYGDGKVAVLGGRGRNTKKQPDTDHNRGPTSCNNVLHSQGRLLVHNDKEKFVDPIGFQNYVFVVCLNIIKSIIYICNK